MTALSAYLKKCRSIHRKAETTESSYYPALEALFDDCTDPQIGAHSELTTKSDKPDLGLYEADAPVLYVEVKLPKVSADELLELDQARRYAKALGGWVLATNLNDFVLGRLEGGRLEEQGRVRLFDDDVFSPQQPKSTPRAGQKLRDILTLGCAQRLTIRDPSQVASLLAVHAKALASVLPQENLGTIKKGFKDWLGADLDDAFLVSTTVQAVVYGVFATWLESASPEDFEWEVTRDALDVGIIAEIVYSALGPSVTSEPQVRGLLEGVAGVLRRVDRDSLAEQFDNRAIEYFYEPFLAAYDPKLRDKLGVWYTPPEIAAYQVARADHHLKVDLGIAEGLADDLVIVLDPAAGTGTYLAAVYEHLFAAYESQGNSGSEAAQLLREAAKTRLVGFEILPAALLIGDLHLRRLLRSRGVPLSRGERPAVYLTNSLTGWFDKDDPDQVAFTWMAAKAEVEAANRYKRDDRVLVVLGNPPYEGYSSAQTEDEKRLVEPWVAPLWKEWGVRKHRLNDLYIRFWAAAALRITQFTGTGVVSFITNRKWLAGKSYPAMRKDLLSSFDRIVVDDLGGHGRGAGGGTEDESVFKTPAASGQLVGIGIVTAIRYRQDGGSPTQHVDDPNGARVTHRQVMGTAVQKRKQLSSFRGDAIDRGLVAWKATKETRWKLGGSSGPADWPGVHDYFLFRRSGVQPVCDPVVTDYNSDALRRRMDDFLDPDLSSADLAVEHPEVERSPHDVLPARRKLLQRNRDTGMRGHEPRRLVKCLWRPLDGRWLYWESDHGLLNRARPELIPYWSVPGQVCLVSTETRRRVGAARPLVSTAVPLNESMEPNARALPLWAAAGAVYEGELALADPGSGPRPNITDRWIRAARAVGVPGDDPEVAETLFFAICGVVASHAWLASQPVEYDDFPTVPLPANAEDLLMAAATGREYGRLVDPWVEVEGVTRGAIRADLRGVAEPDVPKASDPVLEHGHKNRRGGRAVDGSLLWADNEGWRNVSAQVSEFTLGGFNPVGKHLSFFLAQPLTFAHRRKVTDMLRRIAAIEQLSHTADAHFAAAEVSPLEPA